MARQVCLQRNPFQPDKSSYKNIYHVFFFFFFFLEGGGGNICDVQTITLKSKKILFSKRVGFMMASKMSISASDDYKSCMSCNFCMYLLPNSLKNSIKISMIVFLQW